MDEGVVDLMDRRRYLIEVQDIERSPVLVQLSRNHVGYGIGIGILWPCILDEGSSNSCLH